MDEALDWLALIPNDMVRERKIVLRRALGWSWQRIGDEAGMTHEGARKAYLNAMRRLAARLNGNGTMAPGHCRRTTGTVGAL